MLKRIGSALSIVFKKGGWDASRRILIKAGFKCLGIVLMPIGLLFTIFIRTIRPWFLVRINILISERIGHFAGNTELYLCARDAGMDIPDIPYIDLWYHNWPISNRQLARMWERVLNVGPSWLLGSVDRVNARIPGGTVHQIGKNAAISRDIYNHLERFPSHLSFLPDEEEKGIAGLRAIGIPAGAPFVCLNVRDSSYLKKALPWADWGYHDYRDSSIQNYVLAAEELARLGYYVVRMGAMVKEAMNVSHPMIIDYAAKNMRTDFMDVYLSAKCAFFISTGTGIDALAMVFRRPYAFVNLVPVGHAHTHSRNLLFIPKMHWLRSENRPMTLRELLDSGAAYFPYAKEYADAGIELVENTPEEIAAVALELEARFKGTWKSSEEDELLQQRFWNVFQSFKTDPPLHGEIRGRIGAQYLRLNKETLL